MSILHHQVSRLKLLVSQSKVAWNFRDIIVPLLLMSNALILIVEMEKLQLY